MLGRLATPYRYSLVWMVQGSMMSRAPLCCLPGSVGQRSSSCAPAVALCSGVPARRSCSASALLLVSRRSARRWVCGSARGSGVPSLRSSWCSGAPSPASRPLSLVLPAAWLPSVSRSPSSWALWGGGLLSPIALCALRLRLPLPASGVQRPASRALPSSLRSLPDLFRTSVLFFPCSPHSIKTRMPSLLFHPGRLSLAPDASRMALQAGSYRRVTMGKNGPCGKFPYRDIQGSKHPLKRARGQIWTFVHPLDRLSGLFLPLCGGSSTPVGGPSCCLSTHSRIAHLLHFLSADLVGSGCSGRAAQARPPERGAELELRKGGLTPLAAMVHPRVKKRGRGSACPLEGMVGLSRRERGRPVSPPRRCVASLSSPEGDRPRNRGPLFSGGATSFSWSACRGVLSPFTWSTWAGGYGRASQSCAHSLSGTISKPCRSKYTLGCFLSCASIGVLAPVCLSRVAAFLASRWATVQLVRSWWLCPSHIRK